MGALSASGRELFKKGFTPLIPNVVHIPYGDIEALKESVDKKLQLL
jgi:putrescine aminotransferase